MNRPGSLILAATALVSGYVAATAQAPGIAIIDGAQVLERSEIGKDAQERLLAATADWEAQIQATTEELQALSQRRQEQTLTLNEQALRRLEQDIEEKQVEIRRLNDDSVRQVRRLQLELTVEVNQELGPLVERFAAGRALDLILDSSTAQGLLYRSTSLDLTEDFLAMVTESRANGPQE